MRRGKREKRGGIVDGETDQKWWHRLGLAVDACLCGIVLLQSGATLLIMVVVIGFVGPTGYDGQLWFFFFPWRINDDV